MINAVQHVSKNFRTILKNSFSKLKQRTYKFRVNMQKF